MSRPVLTRSASSASWARFGSTTKKTARPSSGWADQFGRPFEDLAADDVERHVDPADLPEIACIHEGTSAQTEHDITI
nr:hypothetical protein [Herbidospora cretacea]